MTTEGKFRVTVTTETGPALSPAFLEFLENKIIDCEDSAARGVPGMAEKAASIRRIFFKTPESRPAPKHYGGKATPTLDDLDKPGEKWGNA